MMSMTTMPNRPLFNIQSSKITSLDGARTAGTRRVSLAVPFSGPLRGAASVRMYQVAEHERDVLQRPSWAL